MFFMNIDYPSYEEEKMIVQRDTNKAQTDLKPVISAEEIIAIQNAISDIPVSDHVLDFAVKMVRSTRPGQDEEQELIRKWVSWGAGPRASQYLVYAAKTRAALDNRLTPSVDDIKQIAEIVLQHRIIVTFAAEAEGINSKDIVKKLLTNLL
jgi:MoxR-like ATPase